MKKNAAKKKQLKVRRAKIIIAVSCALAVCLVGGILYATVIRKWLDSRNDIVVIDANGSEVAYEPEELQAELDAPTFYQGISIDGQNVAGKTLEEVKAMFADKANIQIGDVLDVKFQVGEDLVDLDTTGMTVTCDINSVIDQAYAYGRTSTLEGDDGLKDRYNTITALQKNPIDFASTYTFGTEGCDAVIHNLLDPYNKDAVEATATEFDTENLEFVISESQEGSKVDIDKAIQDFKASIDRHEFQTVITVDYEIIEPTTSAEFLKNYLCLVSSTTSHTTDKPDRNTNIRLVCETIDGLVLQPGEFFNFNQYVGQRTPEKGYKEANGINGGVYVPEYGGGICQANTMLYHSVVKADLQVDDRHNHTYPSDYVDKGTDATVTWEEPNFQFTNNTDYPVAIHAYYADRYVTVEIYGRPLEDGVTIKLIGEELSSTPPGETEYVADPTMPIGSTKTLKTAHTGYQYTSWKVYYDKDGNEIKRVEYFKSTYAMTPTVIQVGTLGSDGKTYPLDTKTGKVAGPSETTAPTSDTSETTPPAENPPENPPADPTPVPDNPPENPPENTPDPTPAPEPENPDGGEGGGEPA